MWDSRIQLVSIRTEHGLDGGRPFRRSRSARPTTSRCATRVRLLAQARGRFWEAAEAIFAAYFTEGRDVGSAEVLAQVASTAGIDADEVREMLAGDRFVAEVEKSEAAAAEGGINGVPFFVFNGRFGLSGAQ